MVASSSEPYVHYYDGSQVKVRMGTGGVVTALEPLLRSTGGSWVAAGLGNADRETADRQGRLKVPDDKGFTLKRVWLSKTEEDGFLSGVSNGALWPLSHMSFVRPQFIDSKWEIYKKVSEKFANSISAEAKKGSLVWVNDYQLLLVPNYLRKLRPDLTIAFFWHIPWPAPQVFSICPWADEMLRAMLANDIVGFHTPFHAQNFLDSVDSTLESRVERATSTVYFNKEPTRIVGLPISIDYADVHASAAKPPSPETDQFVRQRGLDKIDFAISVDRMDYTKGIPEKIRAMDYFLQQHPKYIGKFSLLQIASPTRSHLEPYKRLREEVYNLTEDINWKYSKGGWKPIILVDDYVNRDAIIHLYSRAKMCIVTSLHDGMNLVCKEYVASRQNNGGTLVLSRFAGAAKDMKGALVVNPFSLKSISDAMHAALVMDGADERARMSQLKREVSENDVYHWASSFLRGMSKARQHWLV